MNDTSKPVIILPPLAHAPSPRRGAIGRLILAPYEFVRLRPGRTLGAIVLIGIIGLAVGAIGVSLWTDSHLQAARRAVEKGHNLAAIPHLMACRRIRPDQPEILLLSARVARRTGAWNEADILLDRYSELHGDDESLVLERLLLRATRGELDSAGPLLQARIDRDDPASPWAREALAAGLLYRYRLTEADKTIGRWRELEPNSTFSLMAWGKLNEQLEQGSEALASYRRVLEIDPEYDEARIRLTAQLLLLKNADEAVPHARYLLRRLPDHLPVMLQLAQALDGSGRAGEAVTVLDHCLKLEPANAAALSERGRILLRDGNSAAAESDLYKATHLDPGDGKARYQYFLALTQNGKKEEAAKEQEAIRQIEADVARIKEILLGELQRTPNDPKPYYEVAMIALRAGRPKEALRWLQNALQVGPNYLETHQALAAFYHDTGDTILSARHRAIAARLAGEKPK